MRWRLPAAALALVSLSFIVPVTPANAAPSLFGVSVARNNDGRLEAFAASGATVYHRWQTVASGGWTGSWGSLGAPNGQSVVYVTSARNQDGRVEVYAETYGGSIWHNYQTSAGGAWKGWLSLGCCGHNPVVASNSDGRLEIFIQGTDGIVYHKWQTTVNGSWSDWGSLPGVNSGYDLDVIRAVDGRLQVFVTFGTTYTNRQTSSGWSGWANLGQPATGLSQSSVGMNSDGRLEMFSVDFNGYTYHKWQATSGGWGGWTSMASDSNHVSISVGRNSDGRLETFADWSYSCIGHNWQNTPGGSWFGWYYDLGCPSVSAGVQGVGPEVATNSDGRLEIFIDGADGVVYHAYQQATSGWSGWSAL